MRRVRPYWRHWNRWASRLPALMSTTDTLTSLIAILLGRLELNISTCISVYRSIMRSAFWSRYHVKADGELGLLKYLKEATVETFMKLDVSEKELLNDGVSRRCHR
jgi:hypothetical protein